MLSFVGWTQSYAPAPGNLGTTAIHKDSNAIIYWANNATVTRGPLNIMNISLGDATYGQEADAIGSADGLSVVSLGDGGEVVLTFEYPIVDGPGPDFCVFENGFIDHYMELAFVEVSSDGINFFGFDAISEIPIDSQISNFNISNCGYVNNFAGKYRAEYGTPFDLSELIGVAGLNINSITHVKLIDVIGTIDPMFASFDSQGNIINDPFPTEFESGGFDLDGVGVINSAQLGIGTQLGNLSVYPNPFMNQFRIESAGHHTFELTDAFGRVLKSGQFIDKIDIQTEDLGSGNYFVKLDQELVLKRITKL